MNTPDALSIVRQNVLLWYLSKFESTKSVFRIYIPFEIW